MKKLIAATVFALFLTGCDKEPTLDMTTIETAQTSMDKMKKDLTPEDRERLRKAVTKLSMDAAYIVGDDREALKKLLMAKAQGKTAKEIIAMGEQ